MSTIVSDYSATSIERRSAKRLQAAKDLAFKAAIINVVMFALGAIVMYAVVTK